MGFAEFMHVVEDALMLRIRLVSIAMLAALVLTATPSSGTAQSTDAKVRIGAASSMDQAEAAMRLEELEMERAKANLDLARVRQQLDQRRKGR